MAQQTTAAEMPASTQPELAARMGMIKRMLMVGALFVVVGYLLIVGALVLELT